MAQTKNSRRRHKTPAEDVRDIMCGHSPAAAQCLCDMLEDASLTGTVRASVAKEILERTVGKGQLTQTLDDKAERTFQLVLKVIE